MPIPPQILYPLITGGINLATQLATKPKKQKSATGVLNNFIANLRSDIGRKETFHTQMRSELSTIGKASSRARREARYLGELKGSGGGILSQELQRIQQGQNQAISQASDRATEAQRRETIGLQSQLREAELMREQIVQQTRQANRVQDQQFTQGLIQTGLQTAGQVGAGAIQFGQQQAQAQQQRMNLQVEANQEAEIQRQQSNAVNLQQSIAEHSVDEIADLSRQGHIDTDVAIDLIKLKQKPVVQKPISTRTAFEDNQKVTYNVFSDGHEEVKSTTEIQETDDLKIASTEENRVWNAETNSFETEIISKNKAGQIVKTTTKVSEQKPSEVGTRAIAQASAELKLNKAIIEKYKEGLPPEIASALEAGEPIEETAFRYINVEGKGFNLLEGKVGFLTKNKVRLKSGETIPYKGSWAEKFNSLAKNELNLLRKFIDRYNKAIIKGGTTENQTLESIFG